jgi:hypothetical protein
MKLKHSRGWFAAGPEVARALQCLSDGGFRLYLYLCLQARRDNGCLTVTPRDLAGALHRSRRSILTYLEELRRQQVCHILPAANQHQGSQIEICDSFWPYEKAVTPTLSPEAARYVGQIRNLLAARPCIHSAFTPDEQKLATTLFADQLPLEQVERAILLGCARKYVSLLNGQGNGPITSLLYFRGPLDEVGQTKTSSEYWNYLKLQLQGWEARWLAHQSQFAGANFASAQPAKAKETK